MISKHFSRRMTVFLTAALLLSLLAGVIPPASRAADDSPVYRVTYQSGERYLVVEVLDDDLVHFQLSTTPPGDGPIMTTPMVAKMDYAGPSQINDDGAGTLETAALRIEVDPLTLCVTTTDTARDPDLVLTTTCPRDPKGITLTQESYTDVYGLGSQLSTKGLQNVNWLGRRRVPGGDFGNAMVPFIGGATANTQFPILYALGAGFDNYALFVDHVYRQQWDFTADPWALDTSGDALRWYLISGPTLDDLRQDFMELVGHSPVPPKQMFGLWVSEYGYENWGELNGVLAALENGGFPVDGFVLDLLWFGDVGTDGYIGSLAWDETNFPDPAGFIADLRADHGARLMVIEESYVTNTLPDYTDLAAQGVLVAECEGCEPISLMDWWGVGGMVDWTNPAAADLWHDLRRQHLLDEGIIGHWTDLGEPEYYNPRAWYYGFPELGLHRHVDIHNVYNLLWAESIYRGYQRNAAERRPFIMSRSGTAGIQRYGAALWSGDIGSNLRSLAAHHAAQLHMSLSGVDYYGADIGGFHRSALDAGADMDEMYTIWLANGALLDLPVRPHTFNLNNLYETSPAQIGDSASNLFNIRQRYTLTPYLYSLAHRAWRAGEPFVAPLVYYYQDDPEVRGLASEKLLGRDLLVATVTEYGVTATDVYLPAGTWTNYHTGETFESAGEWISGVPVVDENGIFRLPIFARGGAIVPQMFVDDQTANVLGQRRDGSTRDELILRIYPDGEPSEFTLYEDDGETTAYQSGDVRTTAIRLDFSEMKGDRLTIEAASGDYASAPAERDNVIILHTGGAEYVQVTFNDEVLPRLNSQAEFEAAESGWTMIDGYHLAAKSGKMDVNTAKTFIFYLAVGG